MTLGKWHLPFLQVCESRRGLKAGGKQRPGWRSSLEKRNGRTSRLITLVGIFVALERWSQFPANHAVCLRLFV